MPCLLACVRAYVLGYFFLWAGTPLEATRKGGRESGNSRHIPKRSHRMLSFCFVFLSCIVDSCAVTLQVVGGKLPMDPASEALFTETSDGLILCKLINLAEFDTIDAR